jgi:hypothetical protein
LNGLRSTPEDDKKALDFRKTLMNKKETLDSGKKEPEDKKAAEESKEERKAEVEQATAVSREIQEPLPEEPLPDPEWQEDPMIR